MDNMMKSLVDLIDETIAEVEELKKSKFAASEVSLGDDKAGVGDYTKNGKGVGKKDDDDDDSDDDDDKEKQSDYDKKDYKEMDKEDTEKDDGVNTYADPNRGSHQADPGGPDVPVRKEDAEKADNTKTGYILKKLNLDNIDQPYGIRLDALSSLILIL